MSFVLPTLLLLGGAAASEGGAVPHAVSADSRLLLPLHHASWIEVTLDIEPDRNGSVCMSVEYFDTSNATWVVEEGEECFAAGAQVERVFPSEHPDAEAHLVFSTAETYPIAFDLYYVTLGSAAAAQPWLAALLLCVVYACIAIEVVHKTLVAVLGALTSLLLLTAFGKRPTLVEASEWVDSGTIVLLLGMMVIVEFLGQTGAFERLAVHALERSGGELRKLYVLLCLLCGIMSMVIANVTALLLVGPLTLRICAIADVPAAPFILGEIFMSNIWGAATLIGDPPNVIVGAAFPESLTFSAFLWNALPCSALVSAVVFKFLFWKYSAHISGTRLLDIGDLFRDNPVRDPILLRKCVAVVTSMLIGFVVASQAGVSPAWVAVAGAAILFLIAEPHNVAHVLNRVDWDTLVFFSALFVLIEALAELGLIRAISGTFKLVLGSVGSDDARLLVAMTLFVWLSAFFSAFVDNIPYAITMVPVLTELVADPALRLPLRPLSWALLLGADYGGNGTMLGSSANIVGTQLAADAGETIGFLDFVKVGMPVLFLSAATTNLWCLLMYGAFGIR